jgi:hypothetical protein
MQMILLAGKHYLLWLADIRSMMAATGISKISHVLKANRDARVMACQVSRYLEISHMLGCITFGFY